MIATPRSSFARIPIVAGGAAVAAVLVVTTVRQIRVWQNGFTLWSRVIEREPERVPFAYNNRAEILARSGYRDRALADYDRAIALSSSLKSSAGADRALAARFDRVACEAYNNRGGIFVDMGEMERAIAEYDRSLALNPSLYQAYNNRGAALAKTGRLDRALEDYDKAIALNGGFYEAYLNRSEAAEKLGRVDQALSDLNRAILINPRSAEAYTNRGNLSLKRGEKAAAIADFRKACELGSRQVCEMLPQLEQRP